MGELGIGQSVTRFEDPRLLRGRGNCINDVNLPGQVHAYLRALDTTATAASPSRPAGQPARG